MPCPKEPEFARRIPCGTGVFVTEELLWQQRENTRKLGWGGSMPAGRLHGPLAYSITHLPISAEEDLAGAVKVNIGHQRTEDAVVLVTGQ